MEPQVIEQKLNF